MMWTDNRPETVALLEAALCGLTVTKRMMFGCPCYFANDALCCGVHNDRVFIRLDAADRDRLLEMVSEVRRFEPMPGRVMREYLVLPPELAADGARLRDWLGRAAAYAALLPATVKRTARRRAF